MKQFRRDLLVILMRHCRYLYTTSKVPTLDGHTPSWTRDSLLFHDLVGFIPDDNRYKLLL